MVEVNARMALKAKAGEGSFSISVMGHATGHPEICAGISALLCALEGWLDVCRGQSSPEERVCLQSGEGYFRWRGGRDAAGVYELIVCGFRRLELACPEAIHVTIGDSLHGGESGNPDQGRGKG